MLSLTRFFMRRSYRKTRRPLALAVDACESRVLLSASNHAQLAVAKHAAPQVAMSADFSGSWSFKDFSLNLQLQQNGSKLHGTFSSAAPIHGKVKGKVDGDQAEITAKGKANAPPDFVGKLVIQVNATKTDATHFNAHVQVFLKKELRSQGDDVATKS